MERYRKDDLVEINPLAALPPDKVTSQLFYKRDYLKWMNGVENPHENLLKAKEKIESEIKYLEELQDEYESFIY